MVDTAERGDQGSEVRARLGFSRVVATGLTASVIAVGLAVVAVVLWMAGAQDRVAARGVERMIRGGVIAMEEKLQTITLDFAIWPDAVTALEADDMTWVWENIGISAAVTGTTDLMMVQPTGGRPAYGWTMGMEAEPSYELLPKEVVARAVAPLMKIRRNAREAPIGYYRTPDGIWLLGAARIVTENPDEIPADDARIPRLVFGFKLTEERIAEIGRSFLIDDLAFTDEQPRAQLQSIPLGVEGGPQVGWLTWTPTNPGQAVLRQLALPLGMGLAVLVAVTATAALLIIQSAQSLERALIEAQEANRLKSEFLANVSHELRTPMNGVIGVGSLLKRSPLDQDQTRMVDLLLDSATAQMRLINDLLDLTSLEAGQLAELAEAFVPADVCSEVASLMAVQAEEKGLAFTCTLPQEPRIAVLGDPDRFRRVLMNLTDNAVKFTSEGSVDIRLAVQRRGDTAEIRLAVTDTGPGIGEADRERIFERFRQLDGSLARRHGGTGLGLTITRSLVESMNGAIGVESAPGEGARFTVVLRLPAVDLPDAEAGQQA